MVQKKLLFLSSCKDYYHQMPMPLQCSVYIFTPTEISLKGQGSANCPESRPNLDFVGQVTFSKLPF